MFCCAAFLDGHQSSLSDKAEYFWQTHASVNTVWSCFLLCVCETVELIRLQGLGGNEVSCLDSTWHSSVLKTTNFGNTQNFKHCWGLSTAAPNFLLASDSFHVLWAQATNDRQASTQHLATPYRHQQPNLGFVNVTIPYRKSALSL